MHELLATRWTAILEAESPKALFLVALKRMLIDRFRKQGRRETSLDATAVEAVDPRLDLEVHQAAQQKLERVGRYLEASLSPRDLRIFHARVVLGESSNAVAEGENLSRANIDQIVSRTRRRLKERFGGAS